MEQEALVIDHEKVDVGEAELKKKKVVVLATLGDVGVLLMSFLYVSYIAMLLIMGMGVFWLNIAILALTVVYVLFFIIKILYLNTTSERLGKWVRLCFKYSKYVMRLINATIVIVSLVNLHAKDGADIIKVISIVILVVMLAISVAWDISMIFVRRKIKEVREEWELLPPEDKKNKLEYLVRKVAKSIDGTGELEKFLLTNRHLNDEEESSEVTNIEMHKKQ